MSTTATEPAWERFAAMSTEVHDMLIGAAQCRNHLKITLECWSECTDAERWVNVKQALDRLTRVGI